MNKTRVDDMLLDMITPRLKEIEGRFSRVTAIKLSRLR